MRRKRARSELPATPRELAPQSDRRGVSGLRLFTLTVIALVAFAANPLLARLALKETAIDAASFTSIRLASGAVALWLIVVATSGAVSGSWRGAFALFAYAAPFAFAYVSIEAGAGTLLLFGTVQATMIFAGLAMGERLTRAQFVGFALALCGLVFLLLPGRAAPPPAASALMIVAGIAWSIYSLIGRTTRDPIAANSGNFLRAALLAIALSVAMLPRLSFDGVGAGYAVLSGALASGVGYAIWYAALTGLTATKAAVAQLSVPVLAAGGGVVLLTEPITLRLIVASVMVLGGIALVFLTHRTSR